MLSNSPSGHVGRAHHCLLILRLFPIVLLLTFPSTTHSRVARTNLIASEQGRSIKEPAQAQCTPYYYEPVDSRLSSFPPIWQPAFILPGDTNAEEKWESIRPFVPNISTKGTPSGDITNISYSLEDPDCWWTFSKCATPRREGLPADIADIPEPHTLAYGFDDGPNCSHNAFYDYLVAENQRATMFYIGSNVMDWPMEAQRAVTDGHEICVHTWSHRYMTAFEDRDAFAELYYTMQAIKLVTQVTPTCWRPPFGDVDDRIRSIANGLGLRTILWKYDSNDWRVGIADADEISMDQVDANYEALLREARKGTFNQSGAILLAHELNNFTMAEAIKYHHQLKAAFQNVVPLAVALNQTRPYVEDDIIIPDFLDYISPRPSSNPPSNGAEAPSGNANGESDVYAEGPVASVSNPSAVSDATRGFDSTSGHQIPASMAFYDILVIPALVIFSSIFI